MLLNKFSNKLLNLYSPCISTEPFKLATSWATCCLTCVWECCWNRSHWTQVEQQVRQLVSESFHTGHMCGNLLPNLVGNMWPVWKHYNATFTRKLGLIGACAGVSLPRAGRSKFSWGLRFNRHGHKLKRATGPKTPWSRGLPVWGWSRL